MSLISINWKPTPKGLREFGAVMLMGLVMRPFRRDRLVLRKPTTDTYWCDCPVVSDVEHYERQS